MYKAKKAAGKIGLYALALTVILPILFLLYFVLISFLKGMSQVYTILPRLFGFTPIWDHRKYISEAQYYDIYMVNSAIATLASTAIFLILGVPVSYSIVRFHMRKASTSILVARLLPNILFLLSYYLLFSKLKMIGAYSVLILGHIVFSLPLIVWIMSSFIADIPKELDGTAIIDGCTRQRRLWNVILSISLPGLVICATLSFLGSWNNFQFALILNGEKMRTLPVSLQYFISGTDIRQGGMLAVAIVVIVPAVILTMTLQKYIIKGMIAGVVKE